MINFEPIPLNKPEEIKSLPELFNSWHYAHENDEVFKQYEKRKVCITSFDSDGIINNEIYEQQNKRILFIAKEANVGGTNIEADVKKEDDTFWLELVAKGSPHTRTLFARRIKMMCNAYMSGNYENADKNSLDALRGAAFMNLNKRGGYRYCDWSVLEAYTKRFSEYIRKEIELIKPDIIVCCGRGVEYLLEKRVYENAEKPCELVEVYHPSYFKIPDQKYLETFRNALVEKGIISQKAASTKNDLKTENVTILEKDERIQQKSETVAINPAVPRKGVIIDTNERYDSDATGEMLSKTPNAKISAFGKARKYIENLNKDDYVFYYLKNTGIIAVGKVTSEAKYNPQACECYRDVEILVEPVINPDGTYNGVRLTKELRKELTGEYKRFYTIKTVKYPLLTNNLDDAKDEIKKRLYGEK